MSDVIKKSVSEQLDFFVQELNRLADETEPPNFQVAGVAGALAMTARDAENEASVLAARASRASEGVDVLAGLARRLVALDEVEGPGAEERRTVTLTKIIGWAREALAAAGQPEVASLAEVIEAKRREIDAECSFPELREFSWCFSHGRLHRFSPTSEGQWCTAYWTWLSGATEEEALADHRETYGGVQFLDDLMPSQKLAVIIFHRERTKRDGSKS